MKSSRPCLAPTKARRKALGAADAARGRNAYIYTTEMGVLALRSANTDTWVMEGKDCFFSRHSATGFTRLILVPRGFQQPMRPS
jgi:hypothetical protein